MINRRCKRLCLFIFLILSVTIACSLSPYAATKTVVNSPRIVSTIIPTETLARTKTPPQTAAHTSQVVPTDESITIIGSPEFVLQTNKALDLLRTKAPQAYQKVISYIGVIEEYEKSGMWAWEEPPRFTASDVTAFYSVTWYAASIAHDATHSELYHQYLEMHDGSVPDDAWTGVEVERFCIGYQLEVIKVIGGTQEEIDYLASLDGTHCDVDDDGDCDAADYDLRDW